MHGSQLLRLAGERVDVRADEERLSAASVHVQRAQPEAKELDATSHVIHIWPRPLRLARRLVEKLGGSGVDEPASEHGCRRSAVGCGRVPEGKVR